MNKIAKQFQQKYNQKVRTKKHTMYIKDHGKHLNTKSEANLW